MLEKFFFFCLLRKKCYLSGNSIFMDQSNGGRKWNLKRSHITKMDLFCSIFLSLPFDGEQLNSTVKQRIRSIDHTRIVPLSKTRFTIDSNDTADNCASELRFSFSFFFANDLQRTQDKMHSKKSNLNLFPMSYATPHTKHNSNKISFISFSTIFSCLCAKLFMVELPFLCITFLCFVWVVE